ncbi:MAG: MgtC/SapB family protein [Phycisphaerae bacterium]
MTLEHAAARLGVALAVGLLIGLERQWRHKMAGLRTNTLVAVGAALFCMVAADSPDPTGPVRLAAQIASGIGFLGAGVIIRDGLNVRGLDTAATLWCSAAAGALAGTGSFTLALLGGAIIFLINLLLPYVPSKFANLPTTDAAPPIRYEIRLTCESSAAERVRELLLTTVRAGALVLESIRTAPVAMEVVAGGGGQTALILTCLGTERHDALLEKQVSDLGALSGVTGVRWSVLNGGGGGVRVL